MSARSTEVVRRFYEGLNRRDEAAMTAVVTEDAELHTHVGSVTGRVYGHGDLRPYLADVAEIWDDVTQTVTDLALRDDGRVLATVRFQATAKGSGVHTDQTLGVLFELRDGRIASMRAYASPGEALDAAGPNH